MLDARPPGNLDELRAAVASAPAATDPATVAAVHQALVAEGLFGDWT